MGLPRILQEAQFAEDMRMTQGRLDSRVGSCRMLWPEPEGVRLDLGGSGEC